MQRLVRCLIVSALLLLLAVPFLAAGGQGEAKVGSVALIAKVAGIPFFDAVNSGAQEAAKELGITVQYVNPVEPTAEAQIEVVEAQILQGVGALAVSANDPDALVPVMKKAMGKKIAATSWDSAISPAGRQLFIEPGDMEAVGRWYIQALGKYIGYSGKFAIVSAGAQMAVQNTFIKWMKEELKDPKYAKMELVSTVYGDDVMDKSYTEAVGVLTAYPDLKGIISPTSIGVVASCQAVEDRGLSGKVIVNGIGLPSQNVKFIKDGTMPELILWNPVDLGYLAVYANYNLMAKKITGKAGDKFTTKRLGEFVVHAYADGGTAVTGHSNVVFTKENIDDWAKKL
jgi:rhamnose transport system substrate-binding protein